MATITQRTASSYLLEIDGQVVGPLLAASGGEPVGTVAESPAGTRPFPGKHLAGMTYRPLELVFDFSMQAGLFDWIAKVLDGDVQPLNGAIVELDMARRERSRLEFHDALPLFFALPALDGGSKSPCRFTLHLQPALTRRDAGSGAVVTTPLGKPVRSSVANFRLQLGGTLETRRVAAVQLAGMALSNLRCTAARDEGWYRLVDSFVVQGQSTDADELEGTLVLLAADMKSVLLTVSLHHVGPMSVVALPSADRASVARVEAEFYVETMGLALGPAPVPLAARRAAAANKARAPAAGKRPPRAAKVPARGRSRS
jgi:hypothetical protein